MKSMENYYRWISKLYAERFRHPHMPLVDTIFRYNRRERRGHYLSALCNVWDSEQEDHAIPEICQPAKTAWREAAPRPARIFDSSETAPLELRSVLQLVRSGKLSVTDKSLRPIEASARLIAKLDSFYGMETRHTADPPIISLPSPAVLTFVASNYR